MFRHEITERSLLIDVHRLGFTLIELENVSRQVRMPVHLQGHPLTSRAGLGGERWGEPKGRGRGITPELARRAPPRDGFTDRWVGAPGEEPSPGGRPPRMEKWGAEGSAHTSQQRVLIEMLAS